MKRIFLFLVSLALFFTSGAQNQNSTSPADDLGPIIKFDENSHDFGTIEEGTKATHEFEFINTGDKDLILQDVKASCGCTVPTWPKEPIRPNARARITVVFNSMGWGGSNFHKSVTVTTNMKTDNVKILFIKGTVAKKPAPVEVPQSPVKINQQ
jgi:hypothetical protein